MTAAAWSAAEAAARDSYGRLLAWLATQWRDVQAAEDALSDAFLAALRTWPRDGVPHSPDAWLMAAARRNLLHAARHRRVVEGHAWAQWLADTEPHSGDMPSTAIPDERLRLMYVCAHPAIDSSMHAALMLQVVLGIEAAAIASAFLVSPAAMAQRLVRAKQRIRDAGLRFEEPGSDELPARTQAVLEAVYAAYALSHAQGDGDALPSGLATEALHLARVVTQLRPDSAEAAGLLALLLFSHSRAGARHDARHRFVPLHAQDTARWDRAMIEEGNRILWAAAGLRRPGPFQLEAAIQSAHAQRAWTGTVPWTAIVDLYAQLVRAAPSIGARIGHAAALCEAGRPGEALEWLDEIEPNLVARHQPYWATRAHALALCGQRDPAREAYARAIGLSDVPALRDFLQQRADLL
jgi:RNA polymerase sigma-70 factor, ECF subfamily